jgi:hypothetical protein
MLDVAVNKVREMTARINMTSYLADMLYFEFVFNHLVPLRHSLELSSGDKTEGHRI